MTITYTHENGLYINLTNRCSNSCDFCVRNEDSCIYGSDNLWLDAEPGREEILADIRRHDLTLFDELVFCGYGEPTCRLDDVFWLCDRIRTFSQIPLRINTNGQVSLIAGRNVAPEFAGRLDIVSVSLNAPDAAAYQAMCHSVYGEAAFEAILSFAREVKKYVGRVILSVVDTTISPADIECCRALAVRCGVEFRLREYIG